MNSKVYPLVLVFTFFLSLLTSCATSPPLPPPDQREPLRILLQDSGRVDAAPAAEGLLSRFRPFYVQHVDRMLSFERGLAKGRKGVPVLQLNLQSAPGEKIFGTSEATGIGFYLSGYIHLAERGEYRFQTLSNDGVEIVVGQQVVISDPTIHADRLSTISIVNVPAAGWYPLAVRYFQKRGSASLKLFWQLPGSTGLDVVPQASYRHNP
ncbi:MAG: PA14 domain-containing protein [Thermodesulfobacteriota bacterium]